MKVTPMGAPDAPKPSITVSTTNKGNTVLEKIKQRFGSLPEAAKAPLNKQGIPIPPQPSGKMLDSLIPQNNAQSTASVEPAKVPAANSQPLTAQQAALARQERSLREARRKLEADQAQFKQEQAKYIPKESLSQDTLKTLAEAGISYDRLVELQLNQAPQDPQQELLSKIAALEAKLAETTTKVEDSFKTRDQQAYDQAKKQIQTDVDLLVNSDPAYETLKATGQSKEVVALIEKVFAEEGIILDVEDAAKQIEEIAFERESKKLEQLQKLTKFKAKLGTPAAMQDASTPQPTGSTTLQNNMGSSRPLTPRERAILAFEQANKR